MNDATTTSYEYGAVRLASKSGTTHTLYLGDALGSVWRTVADTRTPNEPMLSDTFSIRHAIIPVHSPRSLAPTPHR
jgi:hypothetical protein